MFNLQGVRPQLAGYLLLRVGAKKSDTCEVRTHAGEPTALAGQRLNHSAKVSTTVFSALLALLKVNRLPCAIPAPQQRFKNPLKVLLQFLILTLSLKTTTNNLIIKSKRVAK